MDRLVTLAVITGAHGVTGEVRLKLFCEDLSRYPSVQIGDGEYRLSSVRTAANGSIARIAGVTDRNAAEALRGKELVVPRSALPELEDGEYYYADLIGLACVSATGEAVGKVVAVDNYGAGDVIDIEGPDGKRFMVPMRPEAVPDWNSERLVIDPDFIQ